MDLEYFLSNIATPSILIPAIKKECRSYFTIEHLKQYDPHLHKVMDPVYRKNKPVTKPDPLGTKDSVGNEVQTTTLEPVNRIPIPLQQLIVIRSAAFLTGGGVKLEGNPASGLQEALYEAVQDAWKRNKLDFKNNAIAERVMSETECAEIWYSRLNADGTVSMRCNIYSPSDGYELLPVFDGNRDLIAFGRGYTVTQPDGAKEEHMDLYTADKLILHTRTNGDWEITETKPLLYGKIPVIYYSARQTAWAIVQKIIERLEDLISNFGDTNDYNGAPILFAKGRVLGFASKGERGKMIEGDGDADIKYVTWEHAPESIKLEINTLFDLIYTCTQTPNISFEQMQGLGDISAIAFDRIMIDAHLKAKRQQDGEYGECIQRRINFLIAACQATQPALKTAGDLDITPVFSLFKIDDVADRISNAMSANGGKPVVSHRTSVAMAGLVDNPQQEYDDIQAQQEAAFQQQQAIAKQQPDPNKKPEPAMN